MNNIKSYIRSLVPEWLILFYHSLVARLAALWYGLPSRHMVVIGITGTKGKTSTANYIWSVLQAGGFKTGLIGTANIRIGDAEQMNEYHMTMPGRFVIQKLLRDMKKSGCTHVVMEVTSEGIKQNRHNGIFFDTAIFTNLSPEHLPSHGGSFERYRAAKKRLFASLGNGKKYINGKPIDKAIIVNADSVDAPHFLEYPAHKKITFGIDSGLLRATNSTLEKQGMSFEIDGDVYTTPIPGIFNVYNALAAIAVGREFGIPAELIKKGITSLTQIPGRMETIDEGQSFAVFVDYAHEKLSINLLLDTAQQMRNPPAGRGGKIIVVIGAEGGGRDKAKRAHLGHAAGEKADFVVVSNVDPYSDDPMEIAEGVAVAVREKGKKDGEDLFVILDRREGIRKALSLAKENDIVLLTAKGAEQSMIIGGKSIQGQGPRQGRDGERQQPRRPRRAGRRRQVQRDEAGDPGRPAESRGGHDGCGPQEGLAAASAGRAFPRRRQGGLVAKRRPARS